MSSEKDEKAPFDEGNQSYASYDNWKNSSNPEFNSLHQVSYTFFIQERDHTEFLLRLKNEKISINAFFQSIIRLFLTDDSRVLSIIDGVRRSYKNQNLEKLRKQFMSSQRDFMEKFALGEDEVEDIFDILEKEGE